MADTNVTTLLASALATATSTGTTAVNIAVGRSIQFCLDLTTAITDGTDTLDVFIQTKADGTNWLDVVHFTQIVGTASTLRYYAELSKDTQTAEFEDGTALGAAAVRHFFGDEWRVRYDIVDGNDAGFTFSVVATCQ